MSWLRSGNIWRMRPTVRGASLSQRAVKWRSPTRRLKSPMAGRIAEGVGGGRLQTDGQE
jgi:hypothetical protein